MSELGEISDNYINEANQPDEENVVHVPSNYSTNCSSQESPKNTSLSQNPHIEEFTQIVSELIANFTKEIRTMFATNEAFIKKLGASSNSGFFAVLDLLENIQNTADDNANILRKILKTVESIDSRSKKQMGDMIDATMTMKYAVAQLLKQPASGNAPAAAKPPKRKRTRNQSPNQRKCTYCFALDHIGRYCPEVKGGQSRQFYLYNNGRCRMPPANAPPHFMTAHAALPTHNADPSFRGDMSQPPLPSNVIPQHMPHDRGNHPWKRRRHQNQRQMVIYDRSQHYHNHYSSAPSRPHPHNSPPPSYRPSQSERDGAKLYDQRERGREQSSS